MESSLALSLGSRGGSRSANRGVRDGTCSRWTSWSSYHRRLWRCLRKSAVSMVWAREVSISQSIISASGRSDSMKAMTVSSMRAACRPLPDTQAMPRDAVCQRSCASTSAIDTLNLFRVRWQMDLTTRRLSFRLWLAGSLSVILAVATFNLAPCSELYSVGGLGHIAVGISSCFS